MGGWMKERGMREGLDGMGGDGGGWGGMGGDGRGRGGVGGFCGGGGGGIGGGVGGYSGGARAGGFWGVPCSLSLYIWNPLHFSLELGHG